MTPRVLLLNNTCLDIAPSQSQWLSTLDLDVVWDEENRRLTPASLEAAIQGFDGVIGPSHPPISGTLMQRAHHLRVMSLAASGVDTLDVAAATAEGIVVTNSITTPASEVVADMTWGLLLAVARQIPQHDRRVRAGNNFRGVGISPWGKAIGIVGLGHIGKAVARRAAAFDMRILTSSNCSDVEFVAKYGIEITSLDDLLSRSDFVSLHKRLTDATRGMIGSHELARMKPTAFIVNSARRELIDEAALTMALKGGRIAGAGLDDPPGARDSELFSLDNVVLTPHIGNRAETGMQSVFRAAVQNAADVLAGRRCESVVNPEVFAKGLRTVRTA